MPKQRKQHDQRIPDADLVAAPDEHQMLPDPLHPDTPATPAPAALDATAPDLYPAPDRPRSSRRPDPAAVETILDQIGEGRGLYEICRADKSLPTAGQFNHWVVKSEELYRKYMAARASAGTLIGQRVEALGRRVEAGLIDPRAADVAMRGYTWAASRMNREAWGDAARVEHTGAGGGPIQQVSIQADVQLGRAMLTNRGLRELAKAMGAQLDGDTDGGGAADGDGAAD